MREAKDEAAAERMTHLRKADMAAEAERLLAGTDWLPQPLRTPENGAPAPCPASANTDHAAGLEPASDLASNQIEPDDRALSASGSWRAAAE